MTDDMTAAAHPHALDEEQIARFRRDGFLILRDRLPEPVLAGVRGVFETVVDKLARRWQAHGVVEDALPGLGFEERYLRLLQSGVTKVPTAWRRILVSRPVHQLWQCPQLVGAVRSLLGDALYAHGVWNGRPRDPFGRSPQVHWHQDAHYYKAWDPQDGALLTAWLPLVPVDENSACLQFAAGSHRRGWIGRQRGEGGEYTAADEAVDRHEVVTAAMRPGDVVLFSDTTLHRSTPNSSGRMRWSIDIRFGQDTPGIVAKTPRGYRCFNAGNPGSVEPFLAWASRYRYEPEDLLDELTNFEEGYDLGVLRAFSRTSPYSDVY
ncbi:phytanoyl-CoA dioxygenase family protein [Streptomyces sp. XM4011]|uniref:phytanoyl-CoA dioxygenase family protein n=1 Tax=Streptomyces TaxID=1883 RepID=UPI001FFB9BFA|nr:phytanoyl-CoA dioxygenase family protein [Streptomyces sp. XM4011]MCK1813214.1 phytanoyl-CoA dioxygenase family protein [Streptomyces sp. XM4011]